MHYLYVCHRLIVTKVGQGGPKSKDCGGCLTSANLPHMNVLGPVIGILEVGQKNRKVGQGILTFLAKVKVTCAIYPIRSFRTKTVHDNVLYL